MKGQEEGESHHDPSLSDLSLGLWGRAVSTAIFALRLVSVAPLNFSQASQIWVQL